MIPSTDGSFCLSSIVQLVSVIIICGASKGQTMGAVPFKILNGLGMAGIDHYPHCLANIFIFIIILFIFGFYYIKINIL